MVTVLYVCCYDVVTLADHSAFQTFSLCRVSLSHTQPETAYRTWLTMSYHWSGHAMVLEALQVSRPTLDSSGWWVFFYRWSLSLLYLLRCFLFLLPTSSTLSTQQTVNKENVNGKN